MSDPDRIPVIVAVGEASGCGTALNLEPLGLIRRAAKSISGVAAAPLLSRADSIAVCHIASWSYEHPSAFLATSFGAQPSDLFDAPIGGQWPARLLDRAAARIASGESTIAVIAGGEAQASVSAMTKAGRDPADAGWTTSPGGPPSFDMNQLGSAAMQLAGLITPVRIYPLFENRLRFETAESPRAQMERCSDLYAAFSRVAESNPYSWNGTARTAADIGTPSPLNRMICEPYPLSMNAMPFVDQAACVIVTSLSKARENAVPESDIVYVWGGAGAEDTSDILDRNSFGRSLAMESTLDRTLNAASIGVDRIDVLDVYSCFPIVPTLATRHLRAPASLIPSVTGGHSSFGGPLSSHSLHSIAASVRAIRGGQHCALVHANGGYMTYQHSILLGDAEHQGGYIGDPEPTEIAHDSPVRARAESGEVVVESVCVEHSRQQEPAQAFLVARDTDGRRIAAQTAVGDIESARMLSLYRTSTPTETVGTTIAIESVEGHIRVQERQQ
ncbi:hypothetical protein CH251_05455 [Rhodococcus sp. 06-462-5]|uniref:hypothetical protein n=1 Tax=unclassified Rhodococcus (in: high G+C Gram-positive bacteria) TaxID=192944 RepID=UPI000B9B5752|nr:MULTISPECIES: hypothetical protein [unclassified Rhodococcus (in: high G+C Gram-positive bacteria)]OZC77237.1 hypothetical protein CH251_05455 [Rhodococcus sp. 06-462-5]OZE63394.1 hypothetical protein CH270_18035 [Rhodococcus sp. 02-925g]